MHTQESISEILIV